MWNVSYISVLGEMTLYKGFHVSEQYIPSIYARARDPDDFRVGSDL